MKKTLFVLIFLIAAVGGIAQTESSKLYEPQPEAGKPMPDFILDNITHFKTTKASLKDFKGKWLFLDFWFTGCTTCIQSFPKTDILQQEFKNEAIFLLVGLNDQKYNKGIQSLYERFRIRKNLQIASAYDSILVERWEINSFPHIIIIDPDGIVYAITDGRDMTISKIRDLLEGKKVSFFTNANLKEFNANNFSGKENTIIYRSLLSKWNGESQYSYITLDSELKYIKESGLKKTMVPLYWLYNYAYTGSTVWDLTTDSLYGFFYPEPVLEIKDSSFFKFDYNLDVGKGTYNYNLIVPPSLITPEYIMETMQHDLKTAFGYEVIIESRLMPVWKLIAKPNSEEKLKTKGNKPKIDDGGNSSGGAAGFTLTNFPVKFLLERVMWYIGMGQPPYFDETGIKTNIDITIDALMTDFEDVKKALQRNGLDLVKGEKEMKVIVIRDPKPENR